MKHSLPLAPAEASICTVQYGAICWRMHRGKVEVLLITSRDTGRWVIPKGWPIGGLTPAGSAAREAWEEAGVEGEVAETSLGLFNYDKLLTPKKALACQVEVFALRVARLKDKFPERGERRRRPIGGPEPTNFAKVSILVSGGCGPRTAYLDGVKFHGSRSSRRLCAWPLAMAVRVALR